MFAGASLHDGGRSWWMTPTYLSQVRGGGGQYDGQRRTELHPIEKTRYEAGLKIGFNF